MSNATQQENELQLPYIDGSIAVHTNNKQVDAKHEANLWVAEGLFRETSTIQIVK